MTFNEADMVRAKYLIKGALLGFTRTWNAHLKADREFCGPNVEYIEFVRNGKFADQQREFNNVVKQLNKMDIPDDICDKISDFEYRMAKIINTYRFPENWDMSKDDNIPNRFNALLKEIEDMKTNLDDYFKDD
jgi:hypothetical protein